MLASAMDLGGVFSGVEGSDKASVLKSCVSLVPGLSPDLHGILYAQLLEREALISTGIGKGIAIPHPRNPWTRWLTAPWW